MAFDLSFLTNSGSNSAQKLQAITGGGATDPGATANKSGFNLSGLLSGIGGDIPNPANAVVGAGTAMLGAGQMLASIFQQRQANKMAPPLTDPSQVAFLSDLNMKRKNLGFSGAGYGQGVDLVNKNLASTLDKIRGVNSGNAGATVAGFATAQAGANQGVNTIASNEANRDQFYTTMSQNLTDKIASRKFDIQNFARIQKMAQAMTNRQAGFDNFANGVGSII